MNDVIQPDHSRADSMPKPNPLAGLFALVLAFLLLVPSTADASEGEASVWLGSSLANASAASPDGPQFGIASQLGIDFGITDFWSIDFGLQNAYHFPAEPGENRLEPMVLPNAFAGFRYKLDIFTYVPYVGISAVTWLSGPRLSENAPLTPAVGAKLTVGIDWRFSRHWSFGGQAELHAVNLDVGSFPNYSTVGLNIAYHFRK